MTKINIARFIRYDFKKLHAHIKAMNMWIETSLTDNLTLESQNSEGKMFSTSEFGNTADEQIENKKMDTE
jgi:hypothetical protein